MRFYAVCTEAIELTHQALCALDQERKGSHRPSRALRVATLYGHLQCRARDGVVSRLGCRQLATAWHLHPRELRADLQDLAAMGWLTVTSSSALGLTIQLHEPEAMAEPAAAATPEAAVVAVEPDPVAVSATTSTESVAAAEPEDTTPQSALVAQFAAIYNQAKPQAWPAYNPSGNGLAPRLQRAIRHAGGSQAFWRVLRCALRAMPEFWCSTYPQGRTGAVCVAALLSGDRSTAGLGVEFWHVFSWGAAAPQQLAGLSGNTAVVGHGDAPGSLESELEKARRLLYWDRDHWRGCGIEAAKLERREKQRLAELLEASGEGLSGTAAEQFSKPRRQH
jgi:hypothetical protein